MTLPPGPEPEERTAFPPRSRLARGALGFVLVTGAVLLGSTIVRAARAFPDDAVLRLCIDGLVVELWLATLAVALGLLRLRPLRSSLGLGPGRLGARDVAILVGGTLAISHALDGWLKLSGLAEDSVLGTLPRTLEGVRGLRLLAALLCIGVAPGIAEELLCRGLVQRAVARSVGPGLGLIASALVFGALHVEPIHASFATLLGLYLAAAAHWSGSTRVPMLCHAVNNVLFVALTSASAAPQPSPTSTAVAAALGVAALVAVGRRARRGPGALSAGPTGSAQPSLSGRRPARIRQAARNHRRAQALPIKEFPRSDDPQGSGIRDVGTMEKVKRGPSVLMLDDGELDDFQALLEEVGIPYARVRGGAIVEGTPPPTDLLIATPRRVEAVRKVGPAVGHPQPMRLVVVREDSNTLREQLRRDGFDYLVRRPVHPEAMRLLVLRCLYRGDERRREPRVAVGFEVGFRTGLKSRRAVLADLSLRGCRLISEHRIDPGRRIRVNVPEALEAGDPVTVAGRVLRVDRPKEKDRAHLYSAAVLFDDVTGDAREAVELLIEDLSLGPATLRRVLTGGTTPPSAAEEKPARAATPVEAEPQPLVKAEEAAESEEPLDVDVRLADAGASAGAEADGPETPPRSSERRGRRRAAYSHTVPAFGKRALRVLVGRDLSVEGMRIEPLPGLELGDRLHLAIYGEPGEAPFLIWATVDRDDGRSGMALSFDVLDAPIAERLERLVGNLPSVESLHDTEAQAMGTVMSEILTD